jgi:tetratricopeptide (TPR) repeat protein
VLRLAGVTAALAPEASTVDLFNPPDAADVYAETQYPAAAGWHPLAVLAGAQWKLILSSRAELYDVRGDASESNDLASQRPAVVHAMRTKLVEMQAAARAPAGSTLSADAAERLRTLGYVSGSSAAKDVDASAPNPANEIEAWTRFESALGLLNRGDASGALGELEALAARYPSGLVFQSSLARALQQTGRPHDAVGVLRRAVARWPSDATLFHDLAVAARAAGDTSEAMRAEQAALAIQGDNPAALNGLGLLHADAGRSSDAAAAFERAAGADPSNAVYWSNLGNARREMGDVAAAEAAYRRALDADPGHADGLVPAGARALARSSRGPPQSRHRVSGERPARPGDRGLS